MTNCIVNLSEQKNTLCDTLQFFKGLGGGMNH